jgi:hypothetical protein
MSSDSKTNFFNLGRLQNFCGQQHASSLGKNKGGVMKLIAFVFVSLFAAHAQAGTVWCSGKVDFQGQSRDLTVNFPSEGADGPINVSDLTANSEKWLVYNVTDHELIRDGRVALITLGLDAKESGVGSVNADDWALNFVVDLIPNQDPNFLYDFQGQLDGKALGPVELVCESR